MGVKIRIRDARVEDKDKILQLIESHPCKWDKGIAKRYYDDYFSDNSVFLKGDKVYVLVSDRRIIGVIGYSLDRYETKNYWLDWYYIDKKYEGQGYGRKLLHHVTRELKRKGVKRLFVDTSSDRFYSNALRMYLGNGFKIEAIIRDYYGKGEDQIILSKTWPIMLQRKYS